MGKGGHEDDSLQQKVTDAMDQVRDAVPRSWRNLGLEGVGVLFNRKKKQPEPYDYTRAVAERLRPKAYVQFDCDWCPRERWVNIVTSAPYAVVGASMLQKVRRPSAKACAWSQVAVGCVAAGYHATRGKWRTFGRRADFWTIAAGSACMTRAVYPGLPPAITAMSLAATPFAPFATSALNTAAMEVQFLRRAKNEPSLQKPFMLHCLAAGTGLGLFALDEVKPHIGCVHAVWHCLSCVAVRQTLALMLDAEAMDERKGQRTASGVQMQSLR